SRSVVRAVRGCLARRARVHPHGTVQPKRAAHAARPSAGVEPGAMTRRELATRQRSWARALARHLARRGTRPNTVSVAGVVFAICASARFLLAWGRSPAPQIACLLSAAAMIQLRLLCNLLDGMLAVEHGLKSPTGDLFNDVPDRIEDVLILA